ncbi:MAG: hypothetical protein J5802_01485 [Butyrivibrio sp.]|nr:hypothetical protein [Butyrivibrio sp.]
MKLKTALVILAAAFIMTGCAKKTYESGSGAVEAKESAAAAEASGGELNETETKVELTEEELNEFTEKFATGGEYFGFLLPEYRSPEEIKWDRVIAYKWNQVISYRSEGVNEEDLSDEEKREFYGGNYPHWFWDDSVVRKSDLKEYIKKHTGLDYCPEPEDVPLWKYNEKYDSFLISAKLWENGSPLYSGKFVSGTREGDLYELRFRPDNEGWLKALYAKDRIITFVKSGDDLIIKSNIFAKDEQSDQTSEKEFALYDELIQEVGEVIKYARAHEEYELPAGISDLFYRRYYLEDEALGYCEKDIDDDGVCELFIGSLDQYENYPPSFCGAIYDMFTVKDGELFHVISAYSERDRYYLCENGVIENESSNSAADSLWFFYRLNSGKLDFIEGLYTIGGMDSDGNWISSTYYKNDSAEQEVTDPNVELYSFDSLDFAKYKYREIDFTPFGE